MGASQNLKDDWKNVPTRTITAGGVAFAYRERHRLAHVFEFCLERRALCCQRRRAHSTRTLRWPRDEGRVLRFCDVESCIGDPVIYLLASVLNT
jgi:hypothetical protein